MQKTQLKPSETIANPIPPLERQPVPTQAAATTQQPSSAQSNIRQIVFMGLRMAIASSILIAATSYLMREQQTLTTHKGFINASITAIKAPIDGQLQLADIEPGENLAAGQVLGSVENRRNPQLELQRQAITTRQQLAQTQLTTLRQKQSVRQIRLAQVRQEQSQQQQVVFQYDGQRIAQAQGEVAQAQQATASALRDYDRLIGLAETNVIPITTAEQAGDRYSQAKLAETAANNRLQQAQAEQVAAQQGIQLQAGGQAQEAELRAQAIEAEIADLNLEESNILTQIQQAQREQFELEQQLNLHQTAPIQTPIAGVVWSNDIQGGTSHVDANEPVLQVLDCNNAWVEAFVSEKEIQALEIGAPAQVKLLGHREQALQGTIRSVRAGVGRLTVGNDVAVPPPEQLRKEVAVKIALAETPSAAQSAQFCGVGQSVEVAFEKAPAEEAMAQQGWRQFLPMSLLEQRLQGEKTTVSWQASPAKGQ